MLDTPTRDILVYKPQTATTRREFNEIRKITHERKNAGPVSVSAQLGYIGREVRGDSQLSGVESGQHKRNASGTGRSLRGEGNGNRGRSAENVRNDQLQKGLNADSRKSKSIDDTGRTSLLRGMAITLSDEQKAETAYHHDRYGNDLLFLYFASKSTAISTVTPKDFCFLLLFV